MLLAVSPDIKKEAMPPNSPRPSIEFIWNTCSTEDLGTRVSLKQEAVDDAFEHAHQMCDQLHNGIENMKSGGAGALDVMGANEIHAWMKELCKYLPCFMSQLYAPLLIP